MTTKLFVGNLGFSIDSDALRHLFAPHGEVESAAVIVDRNTGRSKGFGFVEMRSREAAQAAIAAVDGSEHGGRKVNVSLARPREERPSGGRGAPRRF